MPATSTPSRTACVTPEKASAKKQSASFWKKKQKLSIR
jgi:hypothetical protein